MVSKKGKIRKNGQTSKKAAEQTRDKKKITIIRCKRQSVFFQSKQKTYFFETNILFLKTFEKNHSAFF
jgi:hypothetical protein